MTTQIKIEYITVKKFIFTLRLAQYLKLQRRAQRVFKNSTDVFESTVLQERRQTVTLQAFNTA